jgi:hypothetical protein
MMLLEISGLFADHKPDDIRTEYTIGPGVTQIFELGHRHGNYGVDRALLEDGCAMCDAGDAER